MIAANFAARSLISQDQAAAWRGDGPRPRSGWTISNAHSLLANDRAARHADGAVLLLAHSMLLVKFAPHRGRGIAHSRDDGRKLRFRDAKNLRPISDFVLPADRDARALIALFGLIGHGTPPRNFCGGNLSG